MRVTRLVALLALVGPSALAQAPVTSPAQATMTLEEAISIARRSNPGFLQTANDRDAATASVRSAYGSLLPSVGSSFGATYAKSGRQFQNGAELSANADNIVSSWGVGVNYQVNTGILLAPKAARASRDATEAEITGAAETLRSAVTQQYIAVLQAQARADLQDTLIATARRQLELARARVAVGAATALETTRAEVTLGQVEVAALRERNSVQVEKLRLFQQLGVPQPPGTDVVLTTKFAVTTPSFTIDSLLQVARRQNPTLNALKARERAAGVQVRQRQGQYAPTLSLRTGWGGQSFTFADANYLAVQGEANALASRASCLRQDSIRTRLADPLPTLGCDQIVWTDAMAQAARESNPSLWRYERAPMSFSAQISLPIFDNLNREQAVEQAQVQKQDAMYAVRARELQLTTDVTQAYLNLVTAARVVEMQERNAAKAREELAFAEERYRVGVVNFIEVSTSQSTYQQAQVDYINSIYSYHQAFAALESAVGRPLR